MGDSLVDQRRGVLRIDQWSRTPGGVEHRGIANQIGCDAGDLSDAIEIIGTEARTPGRESRVALGTGARQTRLHDGPGDAIKKRRGGSSIGLEVDRRTPAERVVVMADDDVLRFAIELGVIKPVRRDRRGLPDIWTDHEAGLDIRKELLHVVRVRHVHAEPASSRSTYGRLGRSEEAVDMRTGHYGACKDLRYIRF